MVKSNLYVGLVNIFPNLYTPVTISYIDNMNDKTLSLHSPGLYVHMFYNLQAKQLEYGEHFSSLLYTWRNCSRAIPVVSLYVQYERIREIRELFS